jgi:hypothetical protein
MIVLAAVVDDSVKRRSPVASIRALEAVTVPEVRAITSLGDYGQKCE